VVGGGVGEGSVDGDGAAFVVSGAEGDGGPEEFHLGEVLWPAVLDDLVEDRAEFGVGADLFVERLDEEVNVFLGDPGVAGLALERVSAVEGGVIGFDGFHAVIAGGFS